MKSIKARLLRKKRSGITINRRDCGNRPANSLFRIGEGGWRLCRGNFGLVPPAYGCPASDGAAVPLMCLLGCVGMITGGQGAINTPDGALQLAACKDSVALDGEKGCRL